jgi:Tfp pilus assembly protein PilF
MLVPVLGVVQVGYAALADRFAYMPLIGIYLILASAGLELTRRFPAWRSAVIAVACALLATWAVIAERQVGVWENSDQLFTHALEVTDRNSLVHNNYGVALYEAGEFDRSAQQFLAAISIDRSIPDYHDNLGFLWANLGDMHGAVSEFRLALAISPTDFNANYHMGEALLRLEDFEGAIQHLQRANAAKPNHPEVRRLLNQAQTLQRNRR